MNTGDGIQIGVGIVLAVTMVGVWWYAWEARKQAKASARIAEAALRPLILLWTNPNLSGFRDDHQAYNVYYRNIGNGPAVNIAFHLQDPSGVRSDLSKRVGMGVQEERGVTSTSLAPPIPDHLSVVAVYEDGSHRRWKTTLTLDKGEDGRLGNGESKVERIGGGN